MKILSQAGSHLPMKSASRRAARVATGLVLFHVVSALLVPAASAGDENRPGRMNPMACDELVAGFHENKVTIDSAISVAATDTAPEYCDIRGLIGAEAEPGKGIRFAVWLPVMKDWNRRFYMVGGAGYGGSLNLTAMSVGLNQGYATATTDTGHDGAVFPLATFAYNDPQNERDYSYRAVHETVVSAKALIKAHYGEGPAYNYWVGCSTGGRQGLMEAQRFPEDFDGLVIAAPVLDFTGTQIGGIWSTRALMGEGAIPAAKLPLLSSAELAACDASDGLVDGEITDPRLCHFDAATDLPACPGDIDGDNCFTSAQRDAVSKIYAGPKTTSGEQIFPGYAVGTGVLGPSSAWVPWFLNPDGPSILEMLGTSFMRYLAFSDDPGPDYVWQVEFDFDTDPFRMQRIRRVLDAVNPDMSSFSKRGGKIIQHHGWADAALTPYMSIEYFERVVAQMGLKQTSDFYKLYLVPGMFHCSGGSGPNTFDVFAPLVNWVEHGVEPASIIATHPTSNRTRPLCTYPMVAQYSGSGSIDMAENFKCALNNTR